MQMKADYVRKYRYEKLIINLSIENKHPTAGNMPCGEYGGTI